MSIGTNIRKLRTKSKQSQQEIADLLGIERNTYANWEKESNDIKSEYIPKLSEIFGVDPNELFSEEKRLSISNNSFDNKDNSVGIIVFNISDKNDSEKVMTKIEDLLKLLKNMQK